MPKNVPTLAEHLATLAERQTRAVEDVAEDAVDDAVLRLEDRRSDEDEEAA